MTQTKTALVGFGALIAAVVAGCGDNAASGPETTTPARPATSLTAPATTPVPRTTTAPPLTSAPPARPATCTTVDLTVTLGASEGTAGTLYRALVFTNSGRRTCVIQGFPGVSFVAGDDGHQVGQAAAWVGEKGPAITVEPGAAATAPLGFTNIGAYDPADCLPTPVRGLRVYPPHDKAAEFVPFETSACAGSPQSNHLKVMSVHKGTGLS